MSDSAPVIEIKNLHKEFRTGFLRRKVQVVHDLSLTVEQGEIFGFLGPNGAGKTTTIKILMGLIFATSGEAKLFGNPSTDLKAKSRVGFLPEHPYFYEYLTGFEFLDFYGRLFDLPRSIRTVRVERLLELVGLSHAYNTPLRKYSKGMIQRVGIAQALINDPDLVVLDEPMSGLDPMGRKDVRDIIFRLKKEGKTVFFSSHILQDVEMISDRVAILNKGRLRKLGVLRELLAEQASHQVELTASNISQVTAEQLEAMSSHVVIPGVPITVALHHDRVDDAIRLLHQQNGTVESIVPLKGTLEELFVQQVQESETQEEDSSKVISTPSGKSEDQEASDEEDSEEASEEQADDENSQEESSDSEEKEENSKTKEDVDSE